MSQKKDFFQLHEAPEALLIHLIQSTCRFLSLLYLPYFPAYKMTPNFSRPVTPTAAMCPLRVLLLWALLCLVRGNSPEEIFTRSGSDLLLPIRHNLTLNSAVGQSCDGFSWDYREFSGPPKATHKGCTLSKHFPNVRISENGSLIIHNVTPENDGMYGVRLHNSTGDVIQRDDYIIHVAGKTWEEIFTRPGSDLLLPIRRNLTLIHTDRRRCDGIEWKYRKSSTHNAILILRHRDCTPIVYNERISPNVRISENGSLTIHNVTPENDGIYSMNIHNSTGHVIQRDHYIIHVEVPVSVPVLNVSCHRNGSAEISCRVEEGTNPNIRVSVIGGSQGSYSASSNNITAIVESPGPWNITCSVENGVSKSEMSKPEVTCPGYSPSVQEEIITRLGSDLILPISRHLTLNGTDIQSCDWFFWHYKESTRKKNRGITRHLDCMLTEYKYFPNVRTSENGSLIIQNVTSENDGIYSVDIYNSTGHHILRDKYTVYVQGKSHPMATYSPSSVLPAPCLYIHTLYRSWERRMYNLPRPHHSHPDPQCSALLRLL
ncbi:T-cell surface antigen CD2 isoform X1 [Pyxicephalus adspersus]|uniref:T-cell surface antigen CD2 isoform X1 n=1 Tax=Pyxicephalus adspersus TaxID=30357 RepID=UPI003B5A70BF